MQGRAGKAPKKELVIESPQQYKGLPTTEAEAESVPQVAVSHSNISSMDIMDWFNCVHRPVDLILFLYISHCTLL